MPINTSIHSSDFRTGSGRQREPSIMKGSKSHELEADVPAAELWKIYGTLRFVELVHQLLPQVLYKVDVVRGNGGVGTVIQVTLPPGRPALQSYKEEFVKIDNENRVKEAAATEGDILNLGFTTYLTRFEIIEKGPGSSVIRSTVEYEFDDGRPELEGVASTAPLAAAAEAIVNYPAFEAMNGSLCHELETGLPAADVWEVYGGILVGELIPQLLPEVFSKVELVEGDGGVGTVLLVTFPPGTPGSETFKEEFIKVDNQNYIKEVIVTEGAFLDRGFQKYLVRIEIIGKEDKTSVIRSTIQYEVNAEHTGNRPVVSTNGLAAISEAITKHIKQQRSAQQTPK
ncbi:hypothetical protein EJB05_39469 [Eragrostis curvula]|uniref:Bet v I/Major latex protein domain-containing protein n=1 Tax=Eragrostis curvula TaxID=38414 RepID=A0A5J9TX99_9POAL|nr:hypothetical protein EJB05_39469 [Eragrostis curvula]